MKGKDIDKDVRLAIALECARYSNPETGDFICRGLVAVKRLFPSVSVQTIKRIHRQTKHVNLANLNLTMSAINGKRTGRCGRHSILNDELKGYLMICNYTCHYS